MALILARSLWSLSGRATRLPQPSLSFHILWFVCIRQPEKLFSISVPQWSWCSVFIGYFFWRVCWTHVASKPTLPATDVLSSSTTCTPYSPRQWQARSNGSEEGFGSGYYEGREYRPGKCSGYLPTGGVYQTPGRIFHHLVISGVSELSPCLPKGKFATPMLDRTGCSSW